MHKAQAFYEILNNIHTEKLSALMTKGLVLSRVCLKNTF